jgi:hypothetical protein
MRRRLAAHRVRNQGVIIAAPGDPVANLRLIYCCEHIGPERRPEVNDVFNSVGARGGEPHRGGNPIRRSDIARCQAVTPPIRVKSDDVIAGFHQRKSCIPMAIPLDSHVGPPEWRTLSTTVGWRLCADCRPSRPHPGTGRFDPFRPLVATRASLRSARADVRGAPPGSC